MEEAADGVVRKDHKIKGFEAAGRDLLIRV